MEKEKADAIIVHRMSQIYNQGFYMDAGDGKFRRMNRHILTDISWSVHNLYVNCPLYMDVMYKAIFLRQAIPIYCRNCYKVVAMPRTLEEVMIFEEWMKTVQDCKIGAEKRVEVKNRVFGAYWYNQGLNVGRERYKQVRKFANTISKDITVLLKRGCSEYEWEHGPSDEWKEPGENQLMLEERASKLIDYPLLITEQPPWLKERIYADWRQFWAYQTPYVTYHEEDPDD